MNTFAQKALSVSLGRHLEGCSLTVAPCIAQLRACTPALMYCPRLPAHDQALGIALKLTFQGDNQLVYVETHVCLAVGRRHRHSQVLGAGALLACGPCFGGHLPALQTSGS